MREDLRNGFYFCSLACSCKWGKKKEKKTNPNTLHGAAASCNFDKLAVRRLIITDLVLCLHAVVTCYYCNKSANVKTYHNPFMFCLHADNVLLFR